MNSNDGDKYILQSVANALSILDLLTDHEELNVQDIAQMTGLSRSSAFRLLCTLESKRFVHKTANLKYRLGIKFTAMGNIVQNRMEIVQYAHPHMLELSLVSGETCNLSIWDTSTQIRFVDRVLNTQSMRTDTWIGSIRYAHYLAGGKSLLAFAGEDFQKNYFENADFTPQTENSILTPSQLKIELQKIREQGYSFDNEEAEDGLFCVGAPIFDGNNQAVAAISISGPVNRVKKNLDRNIAQVKQIAADISYSIRLGPPVKPLLH